MLEEEGFSANEIAAFGRAVEYVRDGWEPTKAIEREGMGSYFEWFNDILDLERL
jgi:hypothetical protein